MIKVALIGANGQLGYDLHRVLSEHKWKIFPIYHKDIEIKSFRSIHQCLQPLSIDIVINTAAYHKVDDCELYPKEAFAVNALGVRNLCLWCQKNDKLLVHFSSDYVFGSDSQRQTPYKENDLLGPLNVYGVSKMAGEYFVRSALTKYFLIRTAGLFGISGSRAKGGNFIDYIVTRAKRGDELSIVKDQILSPTYTKNLAENLDLLLQTDRYGLYHMTSKGECSWYAMTKIIISLLGMRVPIHPLSSAQTNRIAKRPTYSALINANLAEIGIDRMNSWQDNIRLYLQEKGYLNGKKDKNLEI